jgi:hypothetical protein
MPPARTLHRTLGTRARPPRPPTHSNVCPTHYPRTSMYVPLTTPVPLCVHASPCGHTVYLPQCDVAHSSCECSWCGLYVALCVRVGDTCRPMLTPHHRDQCCVICVFLWFVCLLAGPRLSRPSLARGPPAPTLRPPPRAQPATPRTASAAATTPTASTASPSHDAAPSSTAATASPPAAPAPASVTPPRVVDSSTDAAQSAPPATVSDDDDFEFSDFQAAPAAPADASAGADACAPQSDAPIAGSSAGPTHVDETASLQDASTDPSGAAAASSSTSDSTPDLQPVTVSSPNSAAASGESALDGEGSDYPVSGALPSDDCSSPVAIEEDQGAPAPASVSPAPPTDASLPPSPDFEHVEHAHVAVHAASVVAHPPQSTAAPTTAVGPVAASAVAEEGSEEDFGDFEVGVLFIGSPPPHSSGS